MKFFANRKYNYTADVYAPRVTDPTSGAMVWEYRRTIKLDFGNDPNATRSVFNTQSPVGRTWQLRNIKDRDGVEPLPGATYTVTYTEPVFNAFRKREGFRLRAALANNPEFEGEYS